MSPQKPRGKPAAQDPFTMAVAEVLRAAVKDRWSEFPDGKDFNAAAARQAGISAETVARILRAETSIRVDYLFHIAVVLREPASFLIAKAEQALRRGVAQQGEIPSQMVGPQGTRNS